MKLDKKNLYHLHFGLGKCYEDIKDYENAFFHFNKGNSLKKETTNYNVQEDITKCIIVNLYQFQQLV